MYIRNGKHLEYLTETSHGNFIKYLQLYVNYTMKINMKFTCLGHQSHRWLMRLSTIV